MKLPPASSDTAVKLTLSANSETTALASFNSFSKVDFLLYNEINKYVIFFTQIKILKILKIYYFCHFYLQSYSYLLQVTNKTEKIFLS